MGVGEGREFDKLSFDQFSQDEETKVNQNPHPGAKYRYSNAAMKQIKLHRKSMFLLPSFNVN